MNIYIGIDVGTTSLKAVAMSDEGLTVGLAKSAYELHANAQKATQKAEDWWRAACEAIGSLVLQIRSNGDEKVAKAKIRAISTSAQGGSTTALDASSAPMIEAITWMDKRSDEEMEELNQKFGLRTFYRRHGWRLTPSSDASKLLWMKKNLPQVYKNATAFPSTLGYINLCLTGNMVEDPTCAAIRRLYDINTEKMSADLLEYLEITEEQLPATLPTGALVGRISKQAALQLGLDDDVLVYNGAHDQYCASIGSGIVDPGELMLATGTAWVLFGVTELPLFSDSFISPCLHPAKNYGALSTVSGIGATFEWFSSLCATPIPELSAGAADRREKTKTLFFRPSASGTGLLIGNSTGAHVRGLSIGHDKYDIALALMEGAAFETALVIEEYKKNGMNDVSSITMTGGATASKLWQSIVADVTGLDVYACTETNSPAIGAAIIAAAEGHGSQRLRELSNKFAPMREKISPSENASYYSNKFAAYKEWRKSHE